MRDVEKDYFGFIIHCYAVVNEEGKLLYNTETGLKYLDIWESNEDDSLITVQSDDVSLIDVLYYYRGNKEEIVKEATGYIKIEKVVGKNEFTIE